MPTAASGEATSTAPAPPPNLSLRPNHITIRLNQYLRHHSARSGGHLIELPFNVIITCTISHYRKWMLKFSVFADSGPDFALTAESLEVAAPNPADAGRSTQRL